MTKRRRVWPWGPFYVAHRRARTPRALPVACLSGALAVVFVTQLRPSGILTVAGCVVIAVAVTSARLAIWRWRHPVISIDELAADMREAMRRAARWN